MKKLRIAVLALAALACGQAWAVGRLADVTVFDRAEGRRLPVYWHQGRAYVVGKPGNEYRVTLRNRIREDVLAIVSVDGVNVVSGETASAQQSGYVLEPRRGLDIQGWRKSLAETAAFYFTALPDSYAARTGRPDNVGVIGVALFQRKAEAVSRLAPAPTVAKEGAADSAQAPAPASEPSAAGAMARRDAERLGTGHGRRESSPARYVEFERATPAPVETIAIYYDSYRNLVAQGVIREPTRLPQPFPGFVPDPGIAPRS